MIEITPTLSLSDAEVTERFVRASGPGGQHVNKVSTAVELTFHIDQSSLTEEVKARLRTQQASRLNADGDLVIDCQEFRSQKGNREAARERLAVMVRHALKRPRARRATKPTAGSKERRLTAKKRRSVTKATRRGGDD